MTSTPVRLYRHCYPALAQIVSSCSDNIGKSGKNINKSKTSIWVFIFQAVTLFKTWLDIRILEVHNAPRTFPRWQYLSYVSWGTVHSHERPEYHTDISQTTSHFLVMWCPPPPTRTGQERDKTIKHRNQTLFLFMTYSTWTTSTGTLQAIRSILIN